MTSSFRRSWRLRAGTPRPLVWLLVVASALYAEKRSLSVASASEQTERTATRAQKTGGTSVVRGRVMTVDGGRPLSRALVTLRALDGPFAQTATADADGVFEFKSVLPATYSLRATATGFQEIEWGANRDGNSAGALVIAEGQVLEGANLLLPRLGIITGRVADEDGEPIDNVLVSALRSEYVGGAERLVPFANATKSTDDRGQFRIYDLPPGDYYIAAHPSTPGEDGQRNELPGYVTTYYPGSAEADGAQKIALSAGRQEANVDIGLVASPTYDVTGTILDDRGLPLSRTELMLMPAADRLSGIPARTLSLQDGGFSFSNVSPGKYVLQGLPVEQDGIDFASLALTVSMDIDGIVLQTKPSTLVRGHIVVEGDQPGFAPEELQILLRPVDFARSPFARGASARIAADWTVELRGLWGPHTLELTRVPAGWGLKSILVGDEDLTDDGIDFERSSGPVRIILTKEVSDVSGIVTDGRGRKTTNAVVIAFAADPAKWKIPSRYIRNTKTDETGEFRVSPLPAGQYLILAVEGLKIQALGRPDILESLRPMATQVTLGERQHLPVNLKLVSVRRF